MLFVSEEIRYRNIESALERNIPDMPAYAKHPGGWHICAGGPSLRKEITRIKKAKGVIVSVNGTHDYLLSKGITPDVFIITDPQEHCKKFVKNPQKNVIYLVAAHCHPTVFDRLENYNVQLWYPLDYELPVSVAIGGGTTVGMRAINIGYTQGFRDIHLWGFDGCVTTSHHAYPQKENEKDEVKKVTFKGKDFYMTEWMCAQAHNFEQMLDKHLDFNITVHTHGVIKHIGDNYAS